MSVDMILVTDLVAPAAVIDDRERTAAHPGAPMVAGVKAVRRGCWR